MVSRNDRHRHAFIIMIEIRAEGIVFRFDPAFGRLESFSVTEGTRQIAPLHRAPWVGTDDTMPSDAAPLMAGLGGDFFCAPFASHENGSPLHGWPPNSAWAVETSEHGTLRAILERSVSGATLRKELSVRDGQPFVYQRHIFRDGAGRISFANHANVSLRDGGLISTSPKRHWETPNEPLESDPVRGRSNLIYPAQSKDPAAFPGRDGPVDLTRFPWNPRHEDFVIGLEQSGHVLGWTAVVRPATRDLFLSLRNAGSLPMTMLWHSNGGRDYAPWNGRHFGCLGVEEGAADHMLGLSTESDLSGPGALKLADGRESEVRHVIGAIAWPTGEAIVDVKPEEGTLRLTGSGGATRLVKFATDFLM